MVTMIPIAEDAWNGTPQNRMQMYYLFTKKEVRHIKYKEDNNLENQNPINMKDLDKVMNELNLCEITSEDLGLIRRYLERLILIIERSRIREYMMLTDSKRRLFLINFVAGLGKGFGQAIGFTVLAALVLYLLSTWVDLPVIGAFIAKLINIVDQYREGR